MSTSRDRWLLVLGCVFPAAGDFCYERICSPPGRVLLYRQGVGKVGVHPENGSKFVGAVENVNIQGQMASCAGLFGVVYNGTLKNIILYDSNGTGQINSGYYPNTQTAWYGIGALAGVAGVAKPVPFATAAHQSADPHVVIIVGAGGDDDSGHGCPM